MATVDHYAHELKQRLAKRRQELLEQMAHGLPPDDYQRTVGRALQIREIFEVLDGIKRKIDD